MVTYTSLTFPKTQSASMTSPGVLIGTVSAPYKSTDNTNKQIIIKCPVGFFLSFQSGQNTAMTITVSNMVISTNINVYKNGVAFTTIPNYGSGGATSKQFTFSNPALNTTCSFNSFFYLIQAYFTYTNPSIGSTDIYTFYCPITYTMSSTVSPFQIVLNSLSYGVVLNTTTSTSAFTNFSYASGSTDSIDYYSPYSAIDSLYVNQNLWNGTGGGYYPSVAPSQWGGNYQLDGLYVNNSFVAKKLVLKCVQSDSGSIPLIEWYDTDANLGNSLAYMYPDKTTYNTFTFNTSLAKGFWFQNQNGNNGLVNIYGVYTNSASSTNLSTNTSLSWPLYSAYGLNVSTTTFTITLPQINTYNLGAIILFRRTGGSNTATTISFKGTFTTGNNLYSSNNTATSTTSQALMPSGTLTIRLTALTDISGNLAWHQT
jgi:hypothetical protein